MKTIVLLVVAVLIAACAGRSGDGQVVGPDTAYEHVDEIRDKIEESGYECVTWMTMPSAGTATASAHCGPDDAVTTGDGFAVSLFRNEDDVRESIEINSEFLVGFGFEAVYLYGPNWKVSCDSESSCLVLQEHLGGEVSVTQPLLTAEELCPDEMEAWLNYLLENGDPALEELAFTFGAQSPEFQFLIRLLGETRSSAFQVGIEQTRIDLVWPRIGEFCSALHAIGNSASAAAAEAEPQGTEPPTATPEGTTMTANVPSVQEDGALDKCGEDTAASVAGEAAVCLYHYWHDSLRSVPIALATSTAVDQIFEVASPDDLLFSGCEEWQPDSPSAICEFVDAEGQFSLQMYLYPSAGGAWYVDSVGFYGNPPGWVPVD